MLAPLHTLLLSPLQPSGLNVLDILLLYVEEVSQLVVGVASFKDALFQADDLPGHALYAARILRELCAVRPSLQSRMVELLRARRMVSRNARGIRNVLNPGVIRYTVQDMVALGRSIALVSVISYSFVMLNYSKNGKCCSALFHWSFKRLAPISDFFPLFDSFCLVDCHQVYGYCHSLFSLLLRTRNSFTAPRLICFLDLRAAMQLERIKTKRA